MEMPDLTTEDFLIAYVVNPPEIFDANWTRNVARAVQDELVKAPDALEFRIPKPMVDERLPSEEPSPKILVACETSGLHRNNPIVENAEEENEYFILISEPEHKPCQDQATGQATGGEAFSLISEPCQDKSTEGFCRAAFAAFAAFAALILAAGYSFVATHEIA